MIHLASMGVTQVTVAHATSPRLGPGHRGQRTGHHPGAGPLRQRHQRHGRACRRRVPVLLRSRILRPPSRRGQRSASPPGSWTGPTWPGTSTNPGTWCRYGDRTPDPVTDGRCSTRPRGLRAPGGRPRRCGGAQRTGGRRPAHRGVGHRRSSGSLLGPGHRRPSRRHRIRLRRHVGQVGGGGLPRAPPDPRRRVQGEWDQEGRPRGAGGDPRRRSAGRGGGDRRAGGRGRHDRRGWGRRSGALPASGGRRNGQRRRRAPGRGPHHPAAPPRRVGGSRSLAPVPAASRPPRRRLPHARCAGGGPGSPLLPELGLEPHRPDVLLLFEADLPNHVENAGGFESQKIEALLCHHSQFESTMGIPSDDPGDGTETPDASRGRPAAARWAPTRPRPTAMPRSRPRCATNSCPTDPWPTWLQARPSTASPPCRSDRLEVVPERDSRACDPLAQVGRFSSSSLRWTTAGPDMGQGGYRIGPVVWDRDEEGIQHDIRGPKALMSVRSRRRGRRNRCYCPWWSASRPYEPEPS